MSCQNNTVATDGLFSTYYVLNKSDFFINRGESKAEPPDIRYTSILLIRCKCLNP